uniref:Perlucin-like protein n=1 Tax=Crassostrea virginica TaxID=6565 RepID=A0A8B8C4Y0_CRAVI|nr:perlucin-like protein [Crassostrea virginica]
MRTMKTYIAILVGILAIQIAESAQSCKKGWILYDKRCYIFSKSPVPFLDAMSACYDLGAQLLEIRDRFEEKWVDLQCRLRGYTYGVWLGFSDIQTEGQFVSLTDARSVRYANWMAGYPNNLNGAEHCAMYWWSHKGWNDSPCSQKINYACTKPIENNRTC